MSLFADHTGRPVLGVPIVNQHCSPTSIGECASTVAERGARGTQHTLDYRRHQKRRVTLKEISRGCSVVRSAAVPGANSW
jgi:hypothetical protein